MTHHLFFSWQSDTPNTTNRSFIESCLEQAIGQLKTDAEIEPADRGMAVDRDTLDVPGSPPIMETIFGKIDRAAVFLSDLTYVAERAGGRWAPNPNVCIEHGYALKALTWRRVIAVMNTAFGDPEQHELPFDVRHTRRPILFHVEGVAGPDARRAAKDALTKELASALKAVFGDDAARAEMRGPAPDPRRAAAETALRELAFDANRGSLPEIVSRPRLTLRLAPFTAAEHRRLEPKRVAEARLRFPPSPCELVHSDSDGRQWWSCAPPRRLQEHMNPETSWRMRLVKAGNLEFQTTIGKRIGDDPQILVDGRHLEALIVRTLERMAEIAGVLKLGGPALATVGLDGVEDVVLIPARGARCMRVREIVSPIASLPDLIPPFAEVLHEQLDIIWQTAGWADGSPSFGSGAWAGYTDERNYGV